MEGKTPQALLDLPKLLLHQRHYLSTFQVLNEWRGYDSMGNEAPLTLADIVNYCTLHEITSPSERQNLIYHMKKMDVIHLANLAKIRADTKPEPD